MWESIKNFIIKYQAWNKIISLMAALALSWTFIEEAKDRTVDWADYIAYAIAMVVSYTPALAVRIVDAITSIKTGGKHE